MLFAILSDRSESPLEMPSALLYAAHENFITTPIAMEFRADSEAHDSDQYPTKPARRKSLTGPPVYQHPR